MRPLSSGDDDHQNDSISFSHGRSSGTHDSSSAVYPYLPNWKRTKMQNTDLIIRLFEQRNDWKTYGNLKVFCNHAIVLAPVKLWWWMTEIFVLLTVAVFAYEFFTINWIIILPAVIIGILEWMAFYKTCLRDPGIQPRPDFVEALKNLISVLASYNGELGTARLVAHPNGQQEKLQFCWRCHHFRSLATLHCGSCDACMMVHDHHCPVFGGCVAKNNLSSFHTMIISMAVFWIYMIGYNIYHMIAQTDSSQKLVSSAEGTTLTFYVILGELFAIFSIPIIVNCTRELCCKSNRNTPQPSPSAPKNKNVTYEILKFARENNLTLEERIQLMELLQIQDSETETHQDLNHNSVYPENDPQSSS